MLKERLERVLLKVQKPAQYIGGELNSVVKDKNEVDIRFAFCFPDTYEIGMSHLGMKILYDLLNKRADCWCERVFAPWIDFEAILRQNEISLYGLESLEPINTFDIIGFSLQYEMSYTNVLNMLNLAGLPVLSKDRDSLSPLVIAGGPCCCNPEPMADFIDLFLLGEAEESIHEVIDLYKLYKDKSASKQEFLIAAASIKGVYVPSLYEVFYNEDKTIKAITATNGAPSVVTKRIVNDLDKVVFPENFIVPYVDIVHDRAVIEIMRGCIRGCRFCQAGYIYRPQREKQTDTLCRQGKSLCDQTGYEELSLSSLSTSDYSQIEKLLGEMVDYTEQNQVNLAMPSMRIDNFSSELLDKIKKVRKSGLTFAPEAGTQRLRDVINKNVLESDVLRSCRLAFEGGYTAVKLYFMIGLPTETLEDVTGITLLAASILNEFFSMPNRPKGGSGINITVSVSTFVPKPHTPFQWVGQDKLEVIKEKQRHLLDTVTSKKIRVKYHESKISVLEGMFARGDRRLGKLIHTAWQKGCYFDSWDEHFYFDRWLSAIEECGLSMEFYANRERSLDEILPWSHINFGVSQEFLAREYKKALEQKVTPNCREQCSGCLANTLLGGACFD